MATTARDVVDREEEVVTYDVYFLLDDRGSAIGAKALADVDRRIR